MRSPRFVPLALLLAPSYAAAGLTVRAEVAVGGAAPALVVRTFEAGDEADTSSGATFFDQNGNRCETLLNAEPVGTQTLVVLKIRCVDVRGRVVRRIAPDLLVTNGKIATVNVGGKTDGVSVRVVVTDEPATDHSAAVRRDFFAEPGSSIYALYSLKHPWASLSCDEGDFPVDFEGGSVFVRLDGRFRAGDVLRTDCTAQTPDGELAVPVVLSFF